MALKLKRRLNRIDVFGLQPLRALFYLKSDTCSLVEGFVAAGCDGGKMHENIFAIFALNKAEPFCGVKPLYRTCFFHLSMCLDLLTYSTEGCNTILYNQLSNLPAGSHDVRPLG